MQKIILTGNNIQHYTNELNKLKNGFNILALSALTPTDFQKLNTVIADKSLLNHANVDNYKQVAFDKAAVLALGDQLINLSEVNLKTKLVTHCNVHSIIIKRDDASYGNITKKTPMPPMKNLVAPAEVIEFSIPREEFFHQAQKQYVATIDMVENFLRAIQNDTQVFFNVCSFKHMIAFKISDYLRLFSVMPINVQSIDLSISGAISKEILLVDVLFATLKSRLAGRRLKELRLQVGGAGDFFNDIHQQINLITSCTLQLTFGGPHDYYPAISFLRSSTPEQLSNLISEIDVGLHHLSIVGTFNNNAIKNAFIKGFQRLKTKEGLQLKIIDASMLWSEGNASQDSLLANWINSLPSSVDTVILLPNLRHSIKKYHDFKTVFNKIDLDKKKIMFDFTKHGNLAAYFSDHLFKEQDLFPSEMKMMIKIGKEYNWIATPSIEDLHVLMINKPNLHIKIAGNLFAFAIQEGSALLQDIRLRMDYGQQDFSRALPIMRNIIYSNRLPVVLVERVLSYLDNSRRVAPTLNALLQKYPDKYANTFFSSTSSRNALIQRMNNTPPQGVVLLTPDDNEETISFMAKNIALGRGLKFEHPTMSPQLMIAAAQNLKHGRIILGQDIPLQFVNAAGETTDLAEEMFAVMAKECKLFTSESGHRPYSDERPAKVARFS